MTHFYHLRNHIQVHTARPPFSNHQQEQQHQNIRHYLSTDHIRCDQTTSRLLLSLPSLSLDILYNFAYASPWLHDGRKESCLLLWLPHSLPSPHLFPFPTIHPQQYYYMMLNPILGKLIFIFLTVRNERENPFVLRSHYIFGLAVVWSALCWVGADSAAALLASIGPCSLLCFPRLSHIACHLNFSFPFSIVTFLSKGRCGCTLFHSFRQLVKWHLTIIPTTTNKQFDIKVIFVLLSFLLFFHPHSILR